MVYVCEYCGQEDLIEHEGMRHERKCWFNPAAKYCYSCKFGGGLCAHEEKLEKENWCDGKLWEGR